ncbi:MAG: hypothetical protein M0R77_00915 [Gammaproteobacteria bacterium]|nr:hypothetical protein [Acholeplasmataceae bacterium]MCK9529116.1 hypothetical protein [Gammaproteobacteria bacterium]
MSNYQNNQQEYQHTILDARYSSMSAPSTEQGKWAAIKWSVNKGEVRMTVFTNDAGDTANNPAEKGRIQATLTPRQFGWFTGAIEEAINATSEYTAMYTHEDYKFFGPGKRSETPLPIWSLIVKRAEDGKISFMLLDAGKKDRPRIPFTFEPARGGKMLIKINGEMVDNPGEVSKTFARGFLNTTVPMINKLCVDNYVHKQPNNNNNNNRGGGNNNYRNNNNNNNNYSGGNQNQGGGSSYQAPASSNFDDDIPF